MLCPGCGNLVLGNTAVTCPNCGYDEVVILHETVQSFPALTKEQKLDAKLNNMLERLERIERDLLILTRAKDIEGKNDERL